MSIIYRSRPTPQRPWLSRITGNKPLHNALVPSACDGGDTTKLFVGGSLTRGMLWQGDCEGGNGSTIPPPGFLFSPQLHRLLCFSRQHNWGIKSITNAACGSTPPRQGLPPSVQHRKDLPRRARLVFKELDNPLPVSQSAHRAYDIAHLLRREALHISSTLPNG